jgi:hypothetical protein
MKELFTLKKDLWNRLSSSVPTLLSEATLQKLTALTEYLENEVQSEYNLSNELTSDIRMQFAKMVWHYKDEEDFEVPIEVMFDLLLESIKAECSRQNHREEDVTSMNEGLRELVCTIPETLDIHESKIRAIVVRSYIIEQFIEQGCPEELAYKFAPTHTDIEHRLLMDILESRSC